MNCATSSANGGIIEVLPTFVKESSNQEEYFLSKKKARIRPGSLRAFIHINGGHYG
jgi:hypothetical protein